MRILVVGILVMGILIFNEKNLLAFRNGFQKKKKILFCLSRYYNISSRGKTFKRFFNSITIQLMSIINV